MKRLFVPFYCAALGLLLAVSSPSAWGQSYCVQLDLSPPAIEGGAISGTISLLDQTSHLLTSYPSDINVEIRVVGTGTVAITCSDINISCFNNAYSYSDVTIPANRNGIPFSLPLNDNTTIDSDRTGYIYLTGYSQGNCSWVVDTRAVTILDNDSTVNLTLLEPNAYEAGQTPARFVVTRAGRLTGDMTVNYSIGGTAVNGTDYTSLSGSIVIPDGAASATNSVTPIDDAIAESPETVVLTLTSGAYQIGASSNATVTIIDNDPVVTIVATDPMASESGDSGLFTVTRTGDTGKPLTVLYSISGSASNGVDYAFLSNTVVIPDGQLSATITVAPIYDLLLEGNETVVLTLKTNGYALDGATNATVTITDYDDGLRKTPVLSSGLAATARYGRFVRGTGVNPGYQSFVVTVDFQQGVPLDNSGGNGSTLFPGLSWASLNHFDATNSTWDIGFQNPIAAFGSRVGGSPLYYLQNYTFGVYAGDPSPYYTNSSTYANALRIAVYDQTTFTPVATNTLTIPNISDTNEWRLFLTNGYSKSLSAYGLTTTLSFENHTWTWGEESYTSNYYNTAYHLTHKASSTNKYIYVVELAGGANTGWMVKDGSNVRAWSRLYTLEFEDRPEWRALLLRQPAFFGSPMPPGLAGKSAEEYLTNGPPVTNAVIVTNSPTSFTTLDQSPELRMHPTLDQFVADMGNDPIALANYVQNEIELTDAIDYNDNGVISDTSINLGGVNRGALGVFLEGQGSPTEQCALLVYLLRKAGYSAIYLFPPHNTLKMVDARLSKLLRTQIRNAVNPSVYNSPTYPTNQLIPVNYPWVGLYLTNESRWVHLFPWLKDTQLEEGLSLYDYMPSAYDNAFKWARAYMYGDTNILSLNPQDDSPIILYPKFIEQTLLSTAPGLSIDDLGVTAWNRRNYYPRWTDFPVPTSVGTSNVAVESLSASSITNVSPSLTNIFNTVSLTISSVANTNTKVASGEMRMAELHNRRLVAYSTKLGSNSHSLTLTLAAFRTNITTTKLFNSDGITNALTTNSICSLTTNVSLGATDDSLQLTVIHKRHRSMPGTFTGTNFWTPYLGFSSSLAVTNVRFLRKGDLAALCLNVGRATRRMLDQHATEIWKMEKAGVAGSMDAYQGSVAYLMGMSFFEKFDEFSRLACRLHKVQPIANFSAGLALLRAKHDSSNQLPNSGDVILVQPALDMIFNEIAAVGNSTLHLDSGDDGYGPHDRVFELRIACGSALEHNTLNHFFEKSDSVSTTRLLQLAQSTATNIIVLTRYNYLTEGTKVPAGSTSQLKDADPVVWAAITNKFTSLYVSNDVVAFVTPGNIYNATRTYHGMGAMVFGAGDYLALIGNGFNGGYSPPLDDATLDGSTIQTVNVRVDQDNSVTFDNSSFVAPSAAVLTGSAVSANDTPEMVHEITASTTLSQPAYEATDGFKLLAQDPNSTRSSVEGDMLDTGALDKGFKRNESEYVMDPVNVITGEFYHNRADLTLNGTMQFQVGCNYSSQNEFDSEFGYGWKLNYAPFLTVSRDTTNALVYSAELDGSVLAYRRQTNSSGVQLPLWKPTVKDNPRLQNLTGSVGNLFNSSITKSTNGTNIVFTQQAPDRGVRTYIQRSFPLGSGGTAINRTRPYLDTWQDNRGNYLKFIYGTNSAYPDWGKIHLIQSSSGNSVAFKYDVYGHILEAWTQDGKWLLCDYDQYGDLVGLTLPDDSQIGFEYQHQVLSTNNTREVYSTHLLIREDKPDGRLLVNDYDNDRRVINQYATVGTDLRLIRNASFVYSNNFHFTNSFTNLVAGYTLVTDYLTNTTRYEYSSSLFTLVADPLSRTNRQTWYALGDTNVGAYAGAMKSSVDARGLVTTFLYDTNGNATTVTLTGDITGAGNTNEVAAKSFGYNTNQLLITVTNEVGNRTVYTYTNPLSAFLRTSEELYASNGTIVAVNVMDYYSVSNASVVNNFLGALGMLHHLTRGSNWNQTAVTDFSYDAHGFLTNEVRHTGTSDPDVTMNYVHNLRGELIQVTDAAGRATLLSYTARGQLQSREVLDENGNRVSLEAWYYNENGELEWYDGPRSGAEDYVFYQRDGAGRVVEEEHMRSRGKSDGTGVEADTGDFLMAVTFHQFDPFNNEVKRIDPRGHYQRMSYDSMGQMIGRNSYDGNAGTNATAVSTEGFAYEPGGLQTRYTNALSGVSQTLYNSKGQRRAQSNADGSTNGWLYYFDGRLRREILRNGAYTELVYDDANLRVFRNFYNSGGTLLKTNLTEKDHRGNVLHQIDPAGFGSTNVWDGLDRVKLAYGPQIVYTNPPGISFPSPGPPSQSVINYYYDAAGITTKTTNALNEGTVIVKDAIGRTTHVQIYGADGTSVRQRDIVYSTDQQSYTVWEGTGTNTIPSVHFSDTEGHDVLTLRFPNYPSSNVVLFTQQTFDVAGNHTGGKQCSWSNGVATTFSTNSSTFDALNRTATQIVGDGATTAFSYDAGGDVVDETLPGGLHWKAGYNSAGQKTNEYNLGIDGTTVARSSVCAYYATGSAFAGLVFTCTDGRGVTHTNSYDNFLRPTSVNYSNFSITVGYDNRDLATNITESFNDPAVGPTTTVRRTFNAYSLLDGEGVYVGNNMVSGCSQGWDSGLRRKGLGMSAGIYGLGYAFGWRADGLLASTGVGILYLTGAGTYGYTDAGLLQSRLVGTRQTTINLRDGAGRIKSLTTSMFGLTKLTETLTWSDDDLLLTDTQARSDFTDSRAMSYANGTRRLTQEALNLDGATHWTNTLVYDNGQAAQSGILTKSGNTSGVGAVQAVWNGTTDPLLRVATETNNTVKQVAQGRINGPATLTARLDGAAQPVVMISTTDSNWPVQWRANLEVAPGSHTIQAEALLPSGMFSTNMSNTFTCNATNQILSESFDGGGFITNRTYKLGTNVVLTLSLTWDPKGRLYKASRRDSTQSGMDWTGVYDGLDRLIRTTEITVTNGLAITNQTSTIDHFYDPEHEFLELGVNENGHVTWKVLGPDTDGTLGGQNGTGGFEAIVPGPELFCPIISDISGNLLAIYDPKHSGSLNWFPSRKTGYGAVPGYRPVPLGQTGPDLGEKSAWRNRWSSSIGLVYMGANWYDPVAGQFVSPDAGGHNSSANLYAFCHGNPWTYWDADGRMGVSYLHAYGGGGHIPFLYRLALIQLGAIFGGGSPGLDEGWGGATATWLQQNIGNPLSSVETTSTTANFISYMGGSFVNGMSDMLRLGQGTGNAIYNAKNGWDVAIGITEDVGRAANIITMVGGGAEGAVSKIGTSSGSAVKTLSGSGPAAGVLEVSSLRPSVGAFRNYSPGHATEFVFDPAAERFAVGASKEGLPPLTSPHQHLAELIGADSANVVGGMFKRGANGEILLNEFSGHFHQNWTPEVRQQITDFLQQRTGQQVIHTPGMSF